MGVEEEWCLGTARAMRKDEGGRREDVRGVLLLGVESHFAPSPHFPSPIFFISRCFFLLTSLPAFGQITNWLEVYGLCSLRSREVECESYRECPRDGAGNVPDPIVTGSRCIVALVQGAPMMRM